MLKKYVYLTTIIINTETSFLIKEFFHDPY